MRKTSAKVVSFNSMNHPVIHDFNKEDFLAQLGAHIANLRKARGYSQDRLCLEAGFARGTLSRIEAGLVDPCASTIARIADTLGLQKKKVFEFPKD